MVAKTSNMTSQNTSIPVGTSIELSILMPCLNEVLSLGICIQKAQQFLRDYRILGEILIGGNGSTDGSIELAESMEVSVVAISQKDYGSPCGEV